MAAEVDSKFAQLVSAQEARVDRITDLHMKRMRDKLPEWALESADVSARMREFARDSILAEIEALRQAKLPDLCPEVDAQGAREGARVGGMLDVLLSGYRSGHRALWEGWQDLVESHESDSERRRELLERGSAFFFEYADRLSGMVTAVYTEERDRALRNREQRRVHLVRELLEGEAADPAPLDYDVDAHHVGLVASGDDAAATTRELARRLDRRLLLVGVTEGTWWAWIGGRTPLAAGARSSIAEVLSRADARLAIGAEQWGVEGFRRTHRQASIAEAIGRRLELNLIHFEDVALEALAGSDVDAARAFVARELSDLTEEDKRSQRLRETLEAYFACGQNAASTAAALGIHEQTVAQRLRAVEERTGYSVGSRRAELETAIRLHRVLPATD